MNMISYILSNEQPVAFRTTEIAAWHSDHQVPGHTWIYLKGNPEQFVVKASYKDVTLDMMKASLS